MGLKHVNEKYGSFKKGASRRSAPPSRTSSLPHAPFDSVSLRIGRMTFQPKCLCVARVRTKSRLLQIVALIRGVLQYVSHFSVILAWKCPPRSNSETATLGSLIAAPPLQASIRTGVNQASLRSLSTSLIRSKTGQRSRPSRTT